MNLGNTSIPLWCSLPGRSREFIAILIHGAPRIGTLAASAACSVGLGSAYTA
ncbi:Uncharacterised protein [Mycobacteroides abscessus subsp. abscessus]|nr:Uncharacterised protein [Mycobacteroides abscessus subsp. abscessus]